jgi:hypothetical protein
MKTNIFKLTCLACLASVILVFSMSSCAVKTQFLTSTVVPAAQGTVQIHINKNKNYVVDIKISNLSPSTRLSPPSNAYVVWLVDNESNSINLGQLNSSDDFMSKNLDAKFEAVSGSKPVKIVITAENDPTTKYPSFSAVVLTTDYLHFKN